MKGAIAAGHPLTARAGARVLEEGGNAVDACVAAAFAAWVAESPLTGPGAGGFALVAAADGRPARLADFFVATPGLGRPEPDRRRDARDRRRLRRRQRDDPGLPDRRAPRAPSRARRPGSRPSTRRTAACPWAELLAPAIELARDGRRAHPPAGAPARDPRPDPAPHGRGTPPLQPAGRRAARSPATSCASPISPTRSSGSPPRARRPLYRGELADERSSRTVHDGRRRADARRSGRVRGRSGASRCACRTAATR